MQWPRLARAAPSRLDAAAADRPSNRARRNGDRGPEIESQSANKRGARRKGQTIVLIDESGLSERCSSERVEGSSAVEGGLARPKNSSGRRQDHHFARFTLSPSLDRLKKGVEGDADRGCWGREPRTGSGLLLVNCLWHGFGGRLIRRVGSKGSCDHCVAPRGLGLCEVRVGVRPGASGSFAASTHRLP